MKALVSISGGLTSFEAAKRTIEKFGKANTELWFADVKGISTEEHAGEDADLYRFLDDMEQLLGLPIQRFMDGRNVWEVVFDEGFITQMVNGSLLAPCSRILKYELLRGEVEKRFRPDEALMIIGHDWTEGDRIEKARKFWEPYNVWFPLSSPPYVDKCHITRWLDQHGIKAPMLYEIGAPHNNCGLACLKAGQSQWVMLLRTNPARYAYNEGKELAFRKFVKKDVAILRDRRNGKTRPMTLLELRKRVERGDWVDRNEWGGCGCFTDIPEQANLFRTERGWLYPELAKIK